VLRAASDAQGVRQTGAADRMLSSGKNSQFGGSTWNELHDSRTTMSENDHEEFANSVRHFDFPGPEPYDASVLNGRVLSTDWQKKLRSPKVQNIKGPAIMTGPLNCLLSAFGNNRRRRSFALADSVSLCRGRDTKERQRRCRQ
jgi:hypothetical protein